MAKGVVVPIRSEPMNSPYFNKPSIEYSGFGTDIIFDCWGGRWFYSCEDAVRRGCQSIIDRFLGSQNEDGEEVNYNDLYRVWNIETSDFGSVNRWNPEPRYSIAPKFVFSWCGPGTSLFDKCGEPVLLVEPDIDSFPEYCRSFSEMEC